MTQDNLFARVLQLRADGLSFRAIEKKIWKTDGSGSRAYSLLNRAKADKKASKKTAGKSVAKKAAGKKAGSKKAKTVTTAAPVSAEAK